MVKQSPQHPFVSQSGNRQVDPQLLQIIKAIQESSAPGLLQSIAYGATIVTAITAVVALLYTAGQVRRTRQTAEDATRVQKARFLFGLDEIFEGQQLREVRSCFFHKYEELSREIEQTLKAKTDEAKKRKQNSETGSRNGCFRLAKRTRRLISISSIYVDSLKPLAYFAREAMWIWTRFWTFTPMRSSPRLTQLMHTSRCAESVTGTQSNLDGELYLSGW